MNPEALAEQLRTRELELHATRQALAQVRAEVGLALDGIARIVGAAGQSDAIERTLETVQALLKAEEAFLVVATSDQGGTVRASTHRRWTLEPHWQWEGVLARARRGRSALVHQPSRLPVWQVRPAFQQTNVNSLLIAPVVGNGVDGVLVAVHSQTGAFDRAALERARSIAPILGEALASARSWRSRVATEKARYLAVEANEAMLRHRYELLVSAMDSAVLMESADARVTLVNPAYVRLFNVDAAETLQGMPAHHVERQAASAFSNPEVFIQRTAEMKQLETMQFDELQMADGRFLERSTRVVRDADDRIGRIWVYRDVTSRVLSTRALAAALSEMEQTDLRRQKVLAQLSHELRSPIQAILAMTEALRSAELTPELADLVHAVRGSSTQVAHLLTDLLDLSRLESGKLRIQTRPIDLGEVVEEVVESFGARAAAKRLTLRVAIAPDVGTVDTDPDRIRQIATNLVSNAIKYTTTGGIQVSVERHAQKARIRVIDSGPGMSPEQQASLFQEYSQVRGTTDASTGVGLGLYISHRLVQRLGGVLSVSSTPGRGSTFTADVPGVGPVPSLPAERPESIHLFGFTASDLHVLGTQCATLGLRLDDASRATHVLVHSQGHPPSGIPTRGNQTLIAVVAVGQSTPEWADTAIRGPVTRSALLRAIRDAERTADPSPRPDPSEGVLLPLFHIIIADDDPAIRRLLEHFFSKMEPTPTIQLAETGAEAVALYKAGRADAVLLDSEMPVLDGRQAALAIRRFERTRPSESPCYMVALTGHDDPDTQSALTEAGVDRIFTKPVRPATLVRMLAQLQQFHAQKQR